MGADMPLLPCRDCHYDVSELARVCPHCGCPAPVSSDNPPQDSAPTGLGGVSPVPVAPATTKQLPVTLIPQQTRMWCWAASGQMIMAYLGDSSVTQCAEASEYFGSVDCCSPGNETTCVNGGWPPFNANGFSNSATPTLAPQSALSFDALRDQIDRNKPVAFAWHQNSGGGHMLVAVGYQIDGAQQYVIVNDPWPPNVGAQYTLPYSAYVAPDPSFQHWVDYYEITKMAPGGSISHSPISVTDLANSTAAARNFIPTALKLFGKDAPGAAATAELAVPIPSISLGLDTLKQQAPSGISSSLFGAVSGSVFNPVLMGNSVVASVNTRMQAPGSWTPMPGNVPWTEILVKLRQQESNESHTPLDQYFLVDVGSLGLHFLARGTGASLTLIPCISEPDLGFVAGKAQPADAIIRVLTEVAKRHNEGPA